MWVDNVCETTYTAATGRAPRASQGVREEPMRPIFVSILLATTVAACAAPSEPTPSPSEARQAPALDKRSNDYVYLRVTRRDFRKCMSPMCGGW